MSNKSDLYASSLSWKVKTFHPSVPSKYAPKETSTHRGSYPVSTEIEEERAIHTAGIIASNAAGTGIAPSMRVVHIAKNESVYASNLVAFVMTDENQLSVATCSILICNLLETHLTQLWLMRNQ
jgi:hypothetical protein